MGGKGSGRPIKHKTEEQRRQAILESKRKYNKAHREERIAYMKQMRSNFNNHIKVKLRPEGIKIFEEYYDYRIVPKIDDEGYTEMQIHEFMNIFGDTMQLGRVPVVDLYFIIECEEKSADK